MKVVRIATIIAFMTALGLTLAWLKDNRPAAAAEGHQAFNPAVFGEVAGPQMTPTVSLDWTATPTSTSTATVSPTSTNTPTATVSPTSTSTPGPTYTPKPSPTLGPPGVELLVFDWNKEVLESHHGFPRDIPPMESANGNWVTPVNYAQGMLYFRAEIKDMPSNKDMKLQFCFWQNGTAREECAGLKTVSYTGNTVVVTWSTQMEDMWQKEGEPIDWTQPRSRNGVAIKTLGGVPVSDFNNWKWGCGTNPDCVPAPKQWYPMDMRFTVFVVEKGKSFSGWDNYIP